MANAKCDGQTLRNFMMDLIFIGVVVVFFAGSELYALFCDTL